MIYPTPAAIAERYIYDPAPGSVHYRDIVNMLKDGIIAQERPSAFIVGLLLFCKEAKLIMVWEGQLFQLPFVKGMNIRQDHPNFGNPFLGPDGKIMTLGGRILSGSTEVWGESATNADNISNGRIELSELTTETITSHPNYDNWCRSLKLSGIEPRYKRVNTRNSLKDCDNYFANNRPYVPGPAPDSVSLDNYRYKSDVIVHGRAAGSSNGSNNRSAKNPFKNSTIVKETNSGEGGTGDSGGIGDVSAVDIVDIVDMGGIGGIENMENMGGMEGVEGVKNVEDVGDVGDVGGIENMGDMPEKTKKNKGKGKRKSTSGAGKKKNQKKIRS